MDRQGGSFGAQDAWGAADDDAPGFDLADDLDGFPPEHAPLAPPSPVGQDERRMQVRAYNHWAGLLGHGNFPAIADLHPETLEDFGPYGILLDFSGRRGVDDPAIRFLGEKLAGECAEAEGGDAALKRLSDVPGRSLLSRITDHYLQILANQAPIGFEAEFTNRRGANVLYRGILMPWSSDGITIDFVFGVINWKELADADTAERLLSDIDAAIAAPIPAALAAPIPPYEGKDMDRMLDLTEFAGDDDGADHAAALPHPAFGAEPESDDAAMPDVLSPFDLVDEYGEEDDGEELAEATEWGAGFSGFGDEDTVYTVDYGAQGLEDGEEDEDVAGVVDPLADDSATLGLASLVSRSGRVKQSVVLPGMASAPVAAAESTPPAEVERATPRTTLEQRLRAAIPQGYGTDEEPVALPRAPVFALPAEETPTPAAQSEGARLAPPAEEAAPDGLYDCLAEARELAQAARSSEDRGRKALYQAVARAYDFSLEAAANPADFDELLAENGLAVQDRAPMTPIVKLVFGADYDKTRLTEYAAVLGHAHRTGVPRGTLDTVLARAEGGLKGVVQAERRARREAAGKPVTARAAVRESLAKKLRKLEPVAFDDLTGEGAEFALVMVRRLPSGELAVLGELPEDIALVEKAAKKLLG